MAAVNGSKDDFPTINSIRHRLLQCGADAVSMELIDRIASIQQITLNGDGVTSEDLPMGDASVVDDVTSALHSLESH